ncbi:MazG family protein [Microbacterium suaedae]|uniref:MazG family protein n=1 Tax=Microbacterium suaedae TaxID=2067813 RepID=UPI000DA1166E|nr:MazG family protein [Microbacterium suaedae]
MTGAGDGLRQAAEVADRVHAECVWSRELTHEKLVPYLTEEAAEVIDAVESGSADALREELGDVLWQILLHSVVSDEFTIDDVAGDLAQKMIHRHPHVFAGETAETPERVIELWNAAKAAEKRERTSVLDGVPAGMPALALAQKVLGKGEKVGAGLSYAEEIQAVEALEQADGEDLLPQSEEELGETILGLVALARQRGWDAERALRGRVRAFSEEVRAAE